MLKHFLLVFLLLLGLPGAQAAAAPAPAFSDVQPGSWYYQAVSEMTQAGWLTGYPDGAFQPDAPISAAEFISLTARINPLPQPKGPVQNNHWAGATLRSALEANWYDWDELPPTAELYDQPISRQLAVKILMRAMLPQAKGDYTSQSAKISDFADLPGRYYEPVLAAYQSGVLTGDADGRFRPQGSLSRAEACAILLRARQTAETGQTSQGQQPEQPQPNISAQTPPTATAAPTARQGGVSQNGRLKVIGTQLCNEDGQAVVLRGMSSHGLQWYGQFASAQAMASTAEYGANVFRLAMYTAEGGYLSQPGLKEAVKNGVAAAVQNDMYVIIDWHILSDGNPMTHLEEAKAFFSEMARLYKDTPNVIYEICNEPNNVSWAGEVRPYAEAVLAAIRAEDGQAVVLIGSPTWSQDVHLAAANPLSGQNLMYTCHFYAGTHGEWLRQRVDEALQSGLPIFFSEWGVSRADGGGGVFLEEAEAWLQFMNQRGLSWCSWSLCDKNESSAALKPGASAGGPWTEQDLSEAGRFVFSHFKD